MPDGLSLLILNALNIDDFMTFAPARNQVGVPLSHPIHISELFTPHSLKPTQMALNYTVAGLAKLLLFNAYVSTQTENFNEYVTKEAMKYPYPMKASLPKV